MFAFVWGWFLELHAARTSNGYSMDAISHVELFAWCQLTGVRLARWQVAAIRSIDMTYLRSVVDAEKKGRDDG